DIKLSNILVRKNPLKIVLGDCGFVSYYKYSKIKNTTAAYREEKIKQDFCHDMFSVGICLLEILGRIKITEQCNYLQLQEIIDENIKDNFTRKILCNLLHSDHKKRYSALQV